MCNKLKMKENINEYIVKADYYYYIDWFILREKDREQLKKLGLNKEYEIIVADDIVIAGLFNKDFVFDITNNEEVTNIVKNYDLIIELNAFNNLLRANNFNIRYHDGVGGYHPIRYADVVNNEIIISTSEIPKEI